MGNKKEVTMEEESIVGICDSCGRSITSDLLNYYGLVFCPWCGYKNSQPTGELQQNGHKTEVKK